MVLFLNVTRDLDLHLRSPWFVKLPRRFLRQPAESLGDESFRSSFEQKQKGFRISNTITTVILRTQTRCVAPFRVVWDSADPRRSVRAEQKHLPPPPPPSAAQLTAARIRYGRRIVRWCLEPR